MFIAPKIVSLAKIIDSRMTKSESFTKKQAGNLGAEKRKPQAAAQHPLRNDLHALTMAVRTLAEVQAQKVCSVHSHLVSTMLIACYRQTSPSHHGMTKFSRNSMPAILLQTVPTLAKKISMTMRMETSFGVM